MQDDKVNQNLNKYQFAELAHRLNSSDSEKGSGFSVKTSGPDAGKDATDSYLVADAGTEERAQNPVSGETLERFANKNAEPLSDHDAYMGAWFPHRSNPEPGYLDVSRAIPRQESNAYARAIKQGLQNRQIAFGEVDEHGKYVDEHNLHQILERISFNILP